MKKTLFLILNIILSLVFNSCRQDGKWDDATNNSEVFGYSVERDNEFLPKPVGEANILKFNVNTKYDFTSIPMYFKYTSSLRGKLMLNGKELAQNKEYQLKDFENNFEYVGLIAGDHQLKFILRNDKGVSLTEEFSLKYDLEEFQLHIDGGQTSTYQGQKSNYGFKISPQNPNETKGYYIKFDSYDGDIYLNNVKVSLNDKHPIDNISSFNVTLIPKLSGAVTLNYVIGNPTTKTDLKIVQDVKPCEIVFNHININSKLLTLNQDLNLDCSIGKIPVRESRVIKYKTWITNATNNNTDGIVNTNNVWHDAVISATGGFNISFKAKKVGSYQYHFQIQDEFGNVSEVKSFDIQVDSEFEFIKRPTSKIFITEQARYSKENTVPDYHYSLRGFVRNFHIKTGQSNKINKINYTIKFNSSSFSAGKIEYTAKEDVDLKSEIKYINEEMRSLSPVPGSSMPLFDRQQIKYFNGTVIITIHTIDGKEVTETLDNVPIEIIRLPDYIWR